MRMTSPFSLKDGRSRTENSIRHIAGSCLSLHLETLQETVVDCMIQQNVMTITVETDFELQAAIDPLVPALKEAVKKRASACQASRLKNGARKTRALLWKSL